MSKPPLCFDHLDNFCEDRLSLHDVQETVAPTLSRPSALDRVYALIRRYSDYFQSLSIECHGRKYNYLHQIGLFV